MEQKLPLPSGHKSGLGISPSDGTGNSWIELVASLHGTPGVETSMDMWNTEVVTGALLGMTRQAAKRLPPMGCARIFLLQ